jgi:trk system potassium uptake protein TrkA
VHVVIVGAGEVGGHLASRLSNESHDIVLIERDPRRGAAVAAQLDIQVVVGSGSSPGVLTEAGVPRADLVAAVTDDDETNLVVSLLASLMGSATTVVRLQHPELSGAAGARLRQACGADLVIDPDTDTAEEILRLLAITGADEVFAMGDGDLMVLGAVVRPDAPVAGRDLAGIAAEHEPDWRFLFGAVTRDGVTTIPRGNQVLLPGDHIRVLTTSDARSEVLDLLGVPGGRAQRVMVLGGGAIGSHVADRLQRTRTEVVLVERDPDRAADLAQRLRRVVVVHGDVTDTDLLIEEGIGSADVVIAATGDDSANVLACAFAATEGRSFTVAVLHRLALLPMVRQLGINAAVSPRTASANAVFRHLRGGLTSVATFLESDAEVDELVVEAGSKAVGVPLAELHLPREFLVGAVIRPGGDSEIARGRTVLGPGDRIVVFSRPEALSSARRMFTA